MSEFSKVDSMADLDRLDQDEVVAGYRHGINDDREPGSDKSRSFWHGWRNAQADQGRAPVDASQRALAAEVTAPQRRAAMH